MSLQTRCLVDNTNIKALFPRFWENGPSQEKTLSARRKNKKSPFLVQDGNFTVNIESDVDDIQLYAGEIRLNVDEIRHDPVEIQLYVGNIARDVGDYKSNVTNITPYIGNYERDVDEIKR